MAETDVGTVGKGRGGTSRLMRRRFESDVVRFGSVALALSMSFPPLSRTAGLVARVKLSFLLVSPADTLAARLKPDAVVSFNRLRI